MRSDSTDPGGLSNLFLTMDQIDASADVRADQYGIRTFISVMGAVIKFEIVLEARIHFDQVKEVDPIFKVPSLTVSDLIASKLLANSDRWGDASVYSRDLIDLAMMDFDKSAWVTAFEKASGAYGDAIKNDLMKAYQAFLNQPIHVQRCCKNLKIEKSPALLIDRVRRLKRYFT